MRTEMQDAGSQKYFYSPNNQGGLFSSNIAKALSGCGEEAQGLSEVAGISFAG